MVPICTERWCTETNEATQTHCYNPVAPAYPVWAYYAHGRQRRCQEEPVSLPSGRLEKTTRSSPHLSVYLLTYLLLFVLLTVELNVISTLTITLESVTLICSVPTVSVSLWCIFCSMLYSSFCTLYYEFAAAVWNGLFLDVRISRSTVSFKRLKGYVFTQFS